MTKKSIALICNIVTLSLLASCGTGPMTPMTSPSPSQAPGDLPPVPLSVWFSQPIYRLGDTLEFNVQITNNAPQPATTTVILNLLGAYLPELPLPVRRLPTQVWSKTYEEKLAPGEKRTFTYPIPPEVYDAVGTGDYEMRVQAFGHNAVAGTIVTNAFKVEVTYPSRLQAGETATVQVVVTNVSSRDVHTVTASASGSIEGMDEQQLGTLPAGGSTTIAWGIIVPNMEIFNPMIFIKSPDGGNTTIYPPDIPITPAPTP